MSQQQESTISGSLYDAYSPSSQKYIEGRMPRVGQKAKFEDGRCYVFCKTALDVTVGQVVAAAEPVEEIAPAAAALAGAYTVGITEASIGVNDWAGGQLVIILGTGNGRSYKIKSNTASGTADLVTVTLYDPLQTAIAATDDITIVPLRASNVIIGTDTTDPVGVACATSTAATDGVDNYLWVQYKGVAYGQTLQVTDGQGIMVGTAGSLVALDATGFCVGVSIEEGATNGVANVCFPT